MTDLRNELEPGLTEWYQNIANCIDICRIVGEIPTFWPAQISLIPYQDIRVLALVVIEIILMHRPISKTVMSTTDNFFVPPINIRIWPEQLLESTSAG